MAINDNYNVNPQQALNQLLQEQYPQFAQQYPQFAQQYGQNPYGQYGQQQGQRVQQGYNNGQQNQQSPPNPNIQQHKILNGIEVASEDEAKGVFAPPDGSIIVMPTISRKFMYAKELGMDGTAPLLKYILDETSVSITENPIEFAEKSEVSNQISLMYEKIEELQNELIKVMDELKSSKEIKGVEDNKSITTRNVKPTAKSVPSATTTKTRK